MKKSLLIILAAFSLGEMAAQEASTYWLNSTLQPSKKRNSTYKKVVCSEGATYAVNTFDRSNNIFMRANSTDPAGEILNGDVVYFYSNGNIESQGKYWKGAKVGIWKRFNTDGSEKAERVYDIFDSKSGAFVYVDEMPTFQGGDEDFNDFLKLSFTEVVNKAEAPNKPLLFSMIINENGQTQNVKIIKGASKALDEKLIKVLSNMPAWNPGKKQGEIVRVILEKEIYCKQQ